VLVSQGNEQTLDIHMTEKEENPLEEKKEKKEHWQEERAEALERIEMTIRENTQKSEEIKQVCWAISFTKDYVKS
jgi:hypothetical protein